MYIVVDDIIGKKRINLDYPICSNKEVAVIKVLINNVQYEIKNLVQSCINDISPGNKKLISSRTYAGRELVSILEGMVEIKQFENDERVIKRNKLRGITEMIFN